MEHAATPMCFCRISYLEAGQDRILIEMSECTREQIATKR